MSRIARRFERLRDEKRVGLITYVTAGDPTLAKTEEILLALDRAGADVLEVGVPFSDPLADGPVIQRASERALAAGTTLDSVLALIARLRPSLRPDHVTAQLREELELPGGSGSQLVPLREVESALLLSVHRPARRA